MLNDLWSVQKVQNQQPSLVDIPLRLVVEEAMDFESQSKGRGEGNEIDSIGLNASEAGEEIDAGTGLVGLRPNW